MTYQPKLFDEPPSPSQVTAAWALSVAEHICDDALEHPELEDVMDSLSDEEMGALQAVIANRLIRLHGPTTPHRGDATEDT